MSIEDRTRSINRRSYCSTISTMNNTTLVYTPSGFSDRPSSSISPIGQFLVPAVQQYNSPSHQKTTTTGLKSIRESHQQRATSSKASTDSFLQSWSNGTQKQYASFIRQWHDFCSKWKIYLYNPPIRDVSRFSNLGVFWTPS